MAVFAHTTAYFPNFSMTPRGPKPRPIAEQRRRGNPHKGPLLPEVRAAPFPTLPEPPPILGPDGREAWALVGEALADAGILQPQYLPLLEMFAEAVELSRIAYRDLEKRGLLRKGAKAAEVVSPLFRIWEGATAKALSIGEHLGASPVAMARLGITTFRGRTLQQELAETYGLEASRGPGPR